MVLESVWVPQISGADIHTAYFGVSFVNPCTGWAVGFGGVIVATTDGQNWTIQRPAAGIGRLADVSFVDSDFGWAVGTGGLILATTNGGRQGWQQQMTDPPVSDELEGVSFVDRNFGWAVGKRTILATTNGGATWTPQQAPLPPEPSFSLHDVCFVDQRTGWAVGDEGLIVATCDGGVTWFRQPSCFDPGDNFFNLFGVSVDNNTNVGWVVGGGGSITEPHGVILRLSGWNCLNNVPTGTWECLNNVPAGTPNLQAVSSTTGWVVGDDDTILSTPDNGSTWRQDLILFRPDSHIYDVSPYGWAVGFGGTILRAMYREVCP